MSLLPSIILLAQVNLPPPPGGGAKFTGINVSDFALIGMVMLGIMAILVGWIVFVRGPKRQNRTRVYKSASGHRSASRHGDEDAHEEDESDEKESGTVRKRKKRRIRRREHRSLNPTLSQTGGLPAPRDPNQHTPHLG